MDGHEQKLFLKSQILQINSKKAAQISTAAKLPNALSMKDKLRDIAILKILDSSSIKSIHRFTVKDFVGIKQLHLYMCPPSTIDDLASIRIQLEVFQVINSGITNLGDILAPDVDRRVLKKFKPMILSRESVTIPTHLLWTKLRKLKMTNCGIAKLDGSLHFLSNVEQLDMSHNSISHVIHLQDCVQLSSLNMSFNRIVVLSNVSRVLGNIRYLNLSHNCIRSLDGIDKASAQL